MPKLKIIKLKDIKGSLVKLPRALAKRAFLIFLGLFLLSSILSAFIYYRHISIVDKLEPQLIGKQFKFKSKIHQEILTTWQERQERFEKVDTKTYPNLFIP